ncbi:MAG: PIN domain-containing protein [Acidobacteria bacterium]|nr:MAG: PIN domain-containing protein [Acidobacteriota bacterium]RPJ58755.1 MAG: PIN domain-containing protein [Acidobacteriota bacterium]
MILVDTSCWIEYFHPRGNARVKERLSAEIRNGTVATCGAVLCELFRGVSIDEAVRLRVVFSGLQNIPTLEEDWAAIQDLALRLKAEGFQPPILDMLVAVVSGRSGATLWHFGDQHFRMIQKVLRIKAEDLG